MRDKLLMGSLGFLILGCSSSEDAATDQFSEAERAIIATLSPMPDLPEVPTNAYANSLDAARFGRVLFSETSYSWPITVMS